MISAAEITAIVKARDESGATIRALQGALDKVGASAKGAAPGFASLTSAVGGAKQAAGGLVTGLGQLGLAAMGIKAIGSAAAGIAGGLVSGNVAMETFETQLTTLMGSADLAKDRIAQLAKIGADTPFELPGLVQAEKVALAFGMTGEKVFKLTGLNADQYRTAIGDMAAGTGTNLTELNVLWGKFGSGATGEAISRLQELGLVTREQMADMGVEFSKSGELMSPLPQAMTVAMKIANDKWKGGMANLSGTFAGQMSTLSDNFNQAKTAIMAPIFDVLKESLVGVNELLSSGAFQEGLKGLAAGVAEFVKGAVDGGKQAFATFGPAIAAGLAQLPAVFASVGATVGPVIQTIADAWGTLVQVFAGDWSPDASINPVVNALGMLALGIRDEVIPRARELWDFFTTTAVPKTLELAGQLQGPLTAALNFLKDTAFPVLTTAIGATSAAVQAVTGFFSENTAAGAVLAGILAAATTAYALTTGAAIAHGIATQATTIATAAMTTATALLNAVLAANPIGLVVIAIAALAAGLIYAYQNSETFRNIVDGAFAVVKKAAEDFWSAAKPVLDGLIGLFQSGGSAASGFVSAVVNGLTSMGGRAVEAVKKMVADIRALLPGSDAEVGPLSDLTAAAMSLPLTLAKGIAASAGVAVNATAEMVAGIKDQLTPGLPNMAAAVGAAVTGTLASTINAGEKSVVKSIDNLGAAAMEAFNSGNWAELHKLYNLQLPDVQEETVIRNASQRFNDGYRANSGDGPSIIRDVSKLYDQGYRALASLEGRAAGGPVSAWRPYVVGERGREMFVPPVGGRILSNSEARQAIGGGGAGGSLVIQRLDVHINGAGEVLDAERLAKKLAPALQDVYARNARLGAY